MEAAGVPFAPVQSLPEVLRDGQVRSLGIVQELDHPTAGSIPIVRLPVTFSTLRATTDAPPPRLGEHGDRGFAP
jgi:crotonobetainyl-CoA:carnitine CoA-transferase CaiB-like acyl-CoA transferase